MDPEFAPHSFGQDKAHLRRPVFASVTSSESAPQPADSPLKVWTGSEWAPAGVKVED